MKKLPFLLIILIIPVFSYSQDTGIYKAPLVIGPKQPFIPTRYIGQSIGRNNIAGIFGIIYEVSWFKNFSVAGGLGIDSWGGRISLQVRKYRNFPYDFYYGVGYSFITGIKSIDMKLKTEPSGAEQDVNLILKSVRCINLSIGKPIRLGRRLRLNFELGYSIPLQKDFFKVNSSYTTLTKESEDSLYAQAPGGLIFGVTFSIGLK